LSWMPLLLGIFFLLGLLSTAGCSLAGDIIPPPALATAQMGEPVTQASPVPTQVEPDPEDDVLLLPPSIRPDLQAGEILYQERCAPCHGPTGQGEGEMADQLEYPATALGDPEVARQALPAEWFRVVTNGRLERFMPPFQSLDEASRWNAVAYALTLHVTPAGLQRGQELYMENCSACHGENGQGGSAGPGLDQSDRFASRTLFSDYAVITAGRQPVMPAYGELLPDEDRWAIAEYVQTLAFQSETGLDVASEQEFPSSGTITGSVFNASTNESPPAGLEITLLGFDGQEQVISRTTEADADGGYRFIDVEVQPGRLFFTTLEYQGVGFRSEVFHYLPGQEALDLPITVYESTQDPGALQVDRLHLFFDASVEGMLQVLELWIISNPTDRVIGPAENGLTFEVQLPSGAENLQFEGGEALGGRYVQTEGGFGLRSPVLPGVGVEELVFSFILPYERRLDFEQLVSHPVQAVVVLTPGEGLEIGGEGLQDQGVQAMGELELRNYRGPALDPGEKLQLRISGPSADFPLAELVIGLAALGAAILVAIVWWVRSGRGEQAHAVTQASVPSMSIRGDGSSMADARPGSPSRQELVLAIAALDADYEAGRIEPEEYQVQRDKLKEQALKAAGDKHD
jgi:mono/diheme cytochrome c family protein